MPKAAVFTIKLEHDLRAEFMAAVEASHRPASQVVRELMREFVERGGQAAFLQRKVDTARASVQAGQGRGNEDMATVRKTITLTEQQNLWIAAQIDAGSYTNDSEAIRDLIRHEQERGFEIESIPQALIEGEQSGEPEPFDFAAFKQRKAAQHG